MQILSCTNLRANLVKIMTDVAMNHTPIMVKQGDAEPVIMMSLSDFESYEETAYLLKSPVNRKRLQESVDQIEVLIKKRQQNA